MAVTLTDLHQSKLGLAAITASLVQTLNETDPTFQKRFLARLQEAYLELRDNPPTNSDNGHLAFETLTWVQQMLTGWSFTEGQGEPFLSHYKPAESADG